jgi:hypothetical protein
MSMETLNQFQKKHPGLIQWGKKKRKENNTFPLTL